MKKLLLVFLLGSAAFGQGKYSYAVVASKFEAQKSAGQYGLNDLARQFMVKYGYTTFLDSEVLPEDAANCQALYVDVLPDNSLLKTKLRVVLKNCRNEIISSAEGESKEKDYRISYNQALRSAFGSLAAKGFPAAVPPPAVSETPVPSSGQPDKTYFSVQPMPQGFQIVDTSPKVVLRISRTSRADVYIAESAAHKGVFIRRDGSWYFEYYDDGRLVSEPFDVVLQ